MHLLLKDLQPSPIHIIIQSERMAKVAVSTSLPIRTAEHVDFHPLAPINADEIQNTVGLIRSQWPAETDLHFKQITLQEPAKAEMVHYLEADFHGYDLPQIDRRVVVTYYLRLTVRFL